MRLALRRNDLTRADVDREIAFHLESRISALVAAGMDPDAARAEALARFGDVETARERLTEGALANERTLALRERLEAAMTDAQYVIRSLGRARAFTAAVVLTLALGIGANAAMFGIIDRLLLRGPAAVVDAEHVFRLFRTTRADTGAPNTFGTFGYVTYALLRDKAQTLDGVAAVGPSTYVAGGGVDGEEVQANLVTHDFFSLLGARPAAGRFFAAEEDAPPGQRVVVLSHDLWQRRYSGQRDAIGKTLRLDGDPFTIVGVAPRGFTGVSLKRVDVWVPMSIMSSITDWRTTWRSNWLAIIVRPKRGVPTATAAAEAEHLFRQHYAGTSAPMKKAELSLLDPRLTTAAKEPPETPVSRWLAAVSAIVLIIACANAANLMLARTTRRRRELAVRLALGVGRWRLARLLLFESVALALMGCAVGLAFAQWGGLLIRGVLLPNVFWDSTPVSGRVLAYSIGVALLAGVIVGIAPVIQARRSDLNVALKSGSPQSGASRSALRQSLVFLQAALSVVLLVGAGLFVRSFHRVTSLDLGYEPDKVLQASIEWPNMETVGPQWDAERERRRRVVTEASRRLRATPGIEAAAVGIGNPFGGAFMTRLWVPGRDSIPKLDGGGPYVSSVEAGYMEATGMRLQRGRFFTTRDGAESERVAIVNEPMARTLWPNEDPLTKCLQVFDQKRPCARVVGVVAESRRFGLREPAGMQFFIPYGQEAGFSGSVVFARPTGDARAFTATMRRIILETDPTILLTTVRVMQDAVDPLTRSWKLGATLFTLFGALALIIAAMGLYSIVAYLVAQRTREFGVRMALGAQTRDIVGLVLSRGLLTVALGLGTGLGVSLLAGRKVGPLLFETSARDVGVFAGAAVTLLGVAVLACWIPARRASRVDAAIALRTEG